MQPPPALGPRALNPPLQYLLRLLDVLAVQIDRVPGDVVGAVVGEENVLGRLAVVGGHGGAVPLAFFGVLVRGGAGAGGVGFVCLFGVGRAGLVGVDVGVWGGCLGWRGR